MCVCLFNQIVVYVTIVKIRADSTMSDFVTPADLEEAGRWLERQVTTAATERRFTNRRVAVRRPAAIHLLIGDSIGRNAGLGSRLNDDVLLDRCRGGATATTIIDRLEFDLAHWDAIAAAEQLPKGSAVYWISANDVYSRWTGLGSISSETLEQIGQRIRRTLVRLTSRTSSLVVLGPLPRPDGELAGVAWEKTAAFHLERTTKRVVEALAEQQEGAAVQFVPLGRYLTKKQGGRHAVRAECQCWYQDDRVHLNSSGYQKLADAEHLPVWLQFAAGI